MSQKLLAIIALVCSLTSAHQRNHNITTISPYITRVDETAPKLATYHPHCVTCAQDEFHYWCVATQKCYFYEGPSTSIVGKDCTQPSKYLDRQTQIVPLINQFQEDLFMSCFTEYLPIEKTTNTTGNYTTATVNDCAYSIDPKTGEKKLGEPARIIVDDSYTKDNDLYPNGAKKYYQIQPYSMCRIMLANTLSTSYRSFFFRMEQTYVYWSVTKLASERFDRLKLLYGQTFFLSEDSWHLWYLEMVSFDYQYNFNQTANMTANNQTYLSDLDQVYKLWPRESLYLHVLNEGDTPQDLIISFSRATHLATASFAAVASLLTLITFF